MKSQQDIAIYLDETKKQLSQLIIMTNNCDNKKARKKILKFFNLVYQDAACLSWVLNENISIDYFTNSFIRK